MKKAITTLGLCALVLVLTSVESNAHITPVPNNNGQIEILNLNTMKLDIAGNGSVGGNKKVDELPKASEPTLYDRVSSWFESIF